MTEHQRLIVVIFILFLLPLTTIFLTTKALYETAIESHRERLVEIARSQARLIEAIAKFDAEYSKDFPGGSDLATLSQLKDAHKNYQGFGETGEFTLAKRDGDKIIFLLTHRHKKLESHIPIPFDSHLALPMQKALSGKSGTIIGLDYRGSLVLAAFEPVNILNYGIVAKIDLEEIKAPFIRIGIIIGFASLIIIFVGTILFLFLTNPIKKKLRDQEDQLRQAQKMESVGQLTGGLAHDFNNILAIILNNLEMFKNNIGKSKDASIYAERAIEAVEKGRSLNQHLLAFSRKQKLQPKLTDLNSLIKGMIEMFQRTLGENIEIKTNLKADLTQVMIDPVQLENALLNLAINSRDSYGSKGGWLLIETDNVPLNLISPAIIENAKPGKYFQITVSDNGRGMSKETLEHVFEPFFTTKDIGQGSGLGLSMVYGFVKQSGGYARIYSEVGTGTTIRIYLPISFEVMTDSEKPEEEAGIIKGHSETILVVEDYPALRETVVDLLGGLGYRIIQAEDGRSALEELKKNHDISLLFTDVVLPGGLNGFDLSKSALEIHPKLKVLFTSGYTKMALSNNNNLGEGINLIEKPYKLGELAKAVNRVLKE